MFSRLNQPDNIISLKHCYTCSDEWRDFQFTHLFIFCQKHTRVLNL